MRKEDSDVIQRVDLLWQKVEALSATQIVQQEQIKRMSDELKDLREQLKETQKAIIENQNAYYKRMIAVQSSILLLVVSTVVGLLVKLFFH